MVILATDPLGNSPSWPTTDPLANSPSWSTYLGPLEHCSARAERSKRSGPLGTLFRYNTGLKLRLVLVKVMRTLPHLC